MIRIFIPLAVITIFLNSCNTNHPSEDKSLNKMKESEVIDKLGNPSERTIVKLFKEKSLLEYQSGLFDVMPENGDTLVIKELRWSNESNTQVIWFEKRLNNEWTSFSNLAWDSNISF